MLKIITDSNSYVPINLIWDKICHLRNQRPQLMTQKNTLNKQLATSLIIFLTVHISFQIYSEHHACRQIFCTTFTEDWLHCIGLLIVAYQNKLPHMFRIDRCQLGEFQIQLTDQIEWMKNIINATLQKYMCYGFVWQLFLSQLHCQQGFCQCWYADIESYHIFSKINTTRQIHNKLFSINNLQVLFNLTFVQNF